MSIADIMKPVAADMKAVDEVIRSNVNSDVVLIRTVGEYIINAGGKRMRPALVLMMAGACGYQGGNDHHVLAAVVEFIHTSTLLHDDVVDESELRRGRETANAMFGNAASVLVGDYLYSRSFEMMVSVDSMPVMQILSQATTVIAEGEVLQLLNVHDANVSLDRYLQVVRYKTAKLFEAAAEIAAVVSNVSPEVRKAAADYGRHLGTAFQLIDDVLDYSGSAQALGKNVGDDLREGKPTLPLIRAMEVGTPEQAQLIRKAIEEGDGDFEAVAQVILSTDALDFTREMAVREAGYAEEALALLPDSPYKTSMQTLLQFVVARDH